MTKQENDEILQAANQLPVEAVRQFETTIKKFFEEDGIPYNVDTLKACRTMANLTHAGLPPLYGQFTAASGLLLTRLIHESDTGLIASPIKP